MSRRSGFTGPALIRLLARWTEVDIAQAPAGFSDRLAEWVGWTDAIPLSAALDAAALPASSSRPDPAAHAAASADLARARTALAAPFDPTDDADAAACRRQYQARQQAMDERFGPLRARLRDLLAQASPQLARLAALDATLERLLGGRERSLLARVPVLLGQRFEQHRRAALDLSAEPAAPALSAGAAEPALSGRPEAPAPFGPPALDVTWRAAFRHDMQTLLAAEIALRLQPAEGLLAAFEARA